MQPYIYLKDGVLQEVSDLDAFVMAQIASLRTTELADLARLSRFFEQP